MPTTQPAIPEREWLTLKEAAAWVGLHHDTLGEYARAAGSPIRRKRLHDRGSKHLYNVASLRAWIESWDDA